MLVVMSTFTVLAWGPMDPSDTDADPDSDGLGNLDEFIHGTNPMDPDTDKGGCPDGWEVGNGFDPKDPRDDRFDTDNDGWSNIREYMEGTDPRDPNTDDDKYPLDSTDPYPLDADGPRRSPKDPNAGEWWDRGNGNAMGQGQEQDEASKGTGNGHRDQYQERTRRQPPKEPGDPGYDMDFDGLVELLGAL
jgi:hypothetical protein